MSNAANTYSVYEHIAPNGLRYVGITAVEPEQRWRNGKGYTENRRFYKDIEHFGWENFTHIVLIDKLTATQAENLEVQLIKSHCSMLFKYGYNISLGGGHSLQHSEETKTKISQTKRGKPCTIETRRRISQAKKGKLRSTETRARIGLARLGKHHSAETRLRISLANKGKPISEETRLRRKQALEIKRQEDYTQIKCSINPLNKIYHTKHPPYPNPPLNNKGTKNQDKKSPGDL